MAANYVETGRLDKLEVDFQQVLLKFSEYYRETSTNENK